MTFIDVDHVSKHALHRGFAPGRGVSAV